MTTDHLGSPRVITDKNGQVIARRDFMPFGEELGAGVGPRTESLKYSYAGSDSIRKRFTGYEKDDETQLDFAEARMYQNKHGRFTAVDPLLASASATNPQTFNRYAYTGNNPINYNDPSGLTFCKNNSSGIIGWNGAVGAACADDSTKVDDQEITLGNRSGGNDSYGNQITPGSTVRFNADGTTRVVRTSAQNQATAQGQSVAEATANTPGQTAAVAAASNAASAAEGGVTQLPTAAGGPTILSLCTDDAPCGRGGSSWSNPLAEAASTAPPLKSVEAIATISEVGSLIPGVGIPFALIAATIRAGQGDLTGAGTNLAAVIPFGAGLSRIGRVAHVAEEVAGAGIKEARALGLAGERAAGITGAKKAIEVGGRNLFPDAIDAELKVLTEVKNVKSLSFTRQLRDYATYAGKEGFKFQLITRPGTRLSGPLKMAIEDGIIIHRPTLPF